MSTTKPSAKSEHPMRDLMRRAASVALVVGLTLVAIASYIPSTGISSCRDAVAGSTTVRVCQPFGPGDAVVVGLVLLLAVLLLWPDLSEFSIAGLITLRRQIEDVRRVADEGKDAAERLTGDAQYIYLSQPTPDLSAAVDSAQESVGSFTADAAITVGKPRRLSDERADLEHRLLRLAGDLDIYVQLLSADESDFRKAQHEGALPVGIVYGQMTALRNWQSQFDFQLRAWGIVRNTVVHVPERLSDHEVQRAIELGDLLLQTARTSVGATAKGSDDHTDG